MSVTFSRVTLPPLWTLDQAKVHLHLTGTAYDADVQQKLDAAQEGILSLLGVCADPAWTAATAPLAVKNAIFLLLAYYWVERGDGNTPNIWPKIYDCLGAGYRDPQVG